MMSLLLTFFFKGGKVKFMTCTLNFFSFTKISLVFWKWRLGQFNGFTDSLMLLDSPGVRTSLALLVACPGYRVLLHLGLIAIVLWWYWKIIALLTVSSQGLVWRHIKMVRAHRLNVWRIQMYSTTRNMLLYVNLHRLMLVTDRSLVNLVYSRQLWRASAPCCIVVLILKKRNLSGRACAMVIERYSFAL